MQPQQRPQQATPFKTDQKPPETTYVVEENGDVKITQTVTTDSYWKAREFMSLMRQNAEALEKTQYNYSAEFVEKMKEQEQKLVDEIALMQPVMVESEVLTKKDYEKQRHEGLKTNVKKALEDKETNYEWFEKIWVAAKHEVTAPIFKELSAEEQSKLLKVLARLKRKGA